MGLSTVFSKNGYPLDEVMSAFQKSIRRGIEVDALYWGGEMFFGGFHELMWQRLFVILSEDIGLAEPALPSQILALYNIFKIRKEKSKTDDGSLQFIHAVLMCARAKKSRIVDSALWAIWDEDYHPIGDPKEIPDYAVDQHTARGRQMGRGMQFFFDEGATLANEVLPDPYSALAQKMAKKEKCTDDELNIEVPQQQSLFFDQG